MEYLENISRYGFKGCSRYVEEWRETLEFFYIWLFGLGDFIIR